MKIGIIFPGYSSQFVGMGKELYDEHRVIQEYFEEAYNCLNNNFIKLCFASSDVELSKAVNAYTSIFLVSSSLYALLLENGIKPDMVLGYGIGNFSAVHAAGGLSFPDGLYLLKKFGSFYEEELSNLNVDILKVNGITSLKIKKILSEKLQIAIFNSETDHLISGDKEEINLLKETIKKEFKIKSQKIDPAMGLYSELMNKVVEQFQVYLEKVDFKDVTIPLINSMDGKEVLLGKRIKKYIIKQISSPIKWNKATDNFKDIDLIIQVGPGQELSDLLKEKYPDKKIVSLNKKADLQEIKQFIIDQQNINLIKDINVEPLAQQ